MSHAHRNEVLLTGTVQTVPEPRQLADGSEVVTFRLLVARDPETGGSDSLECSSTAVATRRAAVGWSVGDVVELTGALRRRFYRQGAVSRPFTLVEVHRARRVPALSRRRTRG
jgi:single-strand DNA-binding protein